MDFSIPDRLQNLKDRYRAFVQEEVLPRERLVAEKGFNGALPQLESLRSIAKDASLWAPQVPRDLGGLGLSLVEFAHIAEELGRSPLGHWACNCQAPDAGNIELLQHAGPGRRHAGAHSQRLEVRQRCSRSSGPRPDHRCPRLGNGDRWRSGA